MNTRNWHNAMMYNTFTTGTICVDYRGIPVSSTLSCHNIKTCMSQMLTVYSTGSSSGNFGVIIGTGDSAETFGDYKLSGSVISGFTYSYTISTGRSGDDMWCRGNYTITNNNSSSITIKELGLMYAGYLMNRKVLEKPITIEAGGVGQIEYKVCYTAPAVNMELDLNVEGVYGVECTIGGSSTALTRIGSAAEFEDPVPTTDLTVEGTSPFDSIVPWSGIEKVDVDGDTMVYIPEFYYCTQYDPYNGTHRWAISAEARDGFEKHPGSGRYVGRYHTATVNSTYVSQTGNKPTVSITRAVARTKSHAKGDNWWLIDYAAWSAIQILYLVEYANWDSQSVLGTGQVSGNLLACGGTDECVYHSYKCNGASNQYRWIEDPWSNCMDWCDGFVASSYYLYLSTDNATYADTVDTLNKYEMTMPTSGYITAYGYDSEYSWAFIPRAATTGLTGTNYITDFVDINGGVQVCAVGGYYSSNAYYGLFYLSANYYSSNAYPKIGSRLLYIP